MARSRPWALDYLQMVVGAAVLAFGISALIVPARLADGGLTGLAIVAHYLTGLGVGPVYFALNLPLLVWAFFLLGLRFVWRTLFGVTAVSLWTAAFSAIRLPLGGDRLLAALYGGLCIGAGLGLILRVGGSTGGTDILARHLYRRYGWPFSQTYLIADVLVLTAVAVWAGLPAAMYAWIATNVSGRVVSYVVEGPRRGRLALMVTAHEPEVLRRVVGELARGATRLRATGAYTGLDRQVLLVAIAQAEVVHLRRIVAEEDPRAFLVVLPAVEVLGEGFWTLAPAAGEE